MLNLFIFFLSLLNLYFFLNFVFLNKKNIENTDLDFKGYFFVLISYFFVFFIIDLFLLFLNTFQFSYYFQDLDLIFFSFLFYSDSYYWLLSFLNDFYIDFLNISYTNFGFITISLPLFLLIFCSFNLFFFRSFFLYFFVFKFLKILDNVSEFAFFKFNINLFSFLFFVPFYFFQNHVFLKHFFYNIFTSDDLIPVTYDTVNFFEHKIVSLEGKIVLNSIVDEQNNDIALVTGSKHMSVFNDSFANSYNALYDLSNNFMFLAFFDSFIKNKRYHLFVKKYIASILDKINSFCLIAFYNFFDSKKKTYMRFIDLFGFYFYPKINSIINFAYNLKPTLSFFSSYKYLFCDNNKYILKDVLFQYALTFNFKKFTDFFYLFLNNLKYGFVLENSFMFINNKNMFSFLCFPYKYETIGLNLLFLKNKLYLFNENLFFIDNFNSFENKNAVQSLNNYSNDAVLSYLFNNISLDKKMFFSAFLNSSFFFKFNHFLNSVIKTMTTNRTLIIPLKVFSLFNDNSLNNLVGNFKNDGNVSFDKFKIDSFHNLDLNKFKNEFYLKMLTFNISENIASLRYLYFNVSALSYRFFSSSEDLGFKNITSLGLPKIQDKPILDESYFLDFFFDDLFVWFLYPVFSFIHGFKNFNFNLFFKSLFQDIVVIALSLKFVFFFFSKKFLFFSSSVDKVSYVFLKFLSYSFRSLYVSLYNSYKANILNNHFYVDLSENNFVNLDVSTVLLQQNAVSFNNINDSLFFYLLYLKFLQRYKSFFDSCFNFLDKFEFPLYPNEIISILNAAVEDDKVTLSFDIKDVEASFLLDNVFDIYQKFQINIKKEYLSFADYLLKDNRLTSYLGELGIINEVSFSSFDFKFFCKYNYLKCLDYSFSRKKKLSLSAYCVALSNTNNYFFSTSVKSRNNLLGLFLSKNSFLLNSVENKFSHYYDISNAYSFFFFIDYLRGSFIIDYRFFLNKIFWGFDDIFMFEFYVYNKFDLQDVYSGSFFINILKQISFLYLYVPFNFRKMFLLRYLSYIGLSSNRHKYSYDKNILAYFNSFNNSQNTALNFLSFFSIKNEFLSLFYKQLLLLNFSSYFIYYLNLVNLKNVMFKDYNFSLPNFYLFGSFSNTKENKNKFYSFDKKFVFNGGSFFSGYLHVGSISLSFSEFFKLFFIFFDFFKIFYRKIKSFFNFDFFSNYKNGFYNYSEERKFKFLSYFENSVDYLKSHNSLETIPYFDQDGFVTSDSYENLGFSGSLLDLDQRYLLGKDYFVDFFKQSSTFEFASFFIKVSFIKQSISLFITTLVSFFTVYLYYYFFFFLFSPIRFFFYLYGFTLYLIFSFLNLIGFVQFFFFIFSIRFISYFYSYLITFFLAFASLLFFFNSFFMYFLEFLRLHFSYIKLSLFSWFYIPTFKLYLSTEWFFKFFKLVSLFFLFIFKLFLFYFIFFFLFENYDNFKFFFENIFDVTLNFRIISMFFSSVFFMSLILIIGPFNKFGLFLWNLRYEVLGISLILLWASSFVNSLDILFSDIWDDFVIDANVLNGYNYFRLYGLENVFSLFNVSDQGSIFGLEKVGNRIPDAWSNAYLPEFLSNSYNPLVSKKRAHFSPLMKFYRHEFSFFYSLFSSGHFSSLFTSTFIFNYGLYFYPLLMNISDEEIFSFYKLNFANTRMNMWGSYKIENDTFASFYKQGWNIVDEVGYDSTPRGGMSGQDLKFKKGSFVKKDYFSDFSYIYDYSPNQAPEVFARVDYNRHNYMNDSDLLFTKLLVPDIGFLGSSYWGIDFEFMVLDNNMVNHGVFDLTTRGYGDRRF